MAQVYSNTTTAGNTTILTQPGADNGNIEKVLVCNRSNNQAIVSLWINRVSPSRQYFLCKNVEMPGGSSFVLEDNVSFDGNIYSLRMLNTGSNPSIDVIIK